MLPPTIAAALARGATILTPNQRSARVLRQAFEAAQTSTTFTPPDILAFSSWLSSLWTDLTLTGQTTETLLNRSQEHHLWRAILTADPELPPLRSPDSLAEMAAAAFRTLHLHNGAAALATLGTTTDTRAFERWARRFERTCLRNYYITESQLPAALTKPPQTPLLLVDFDHLPPAHAQLLARIPHQHHRTTLAAPDLHLHTAPDPHSELETAAHHLRQLLADAPNTRIAVVVPDLAARRPEITRVFAEILSPNLNRITADPAQLPFEFSLGHPLSELPLVQTALDLLRLAQAALPLTTLGALLLSPWFTPSAELLAAAEFEAYELHETKLLRPELTLPALLRLLQSSPRADRLEALTQRLHTMLQAAQHLHLDTPDLQPHTGWSEAFRQFLHASGWTQLASATSLAYQTQTRFDSALDELATLDFNGLRTSAADALRALTRICTQTIFAPESRGASIQILGPLELAAEPFDFLWFLSAGGQTWPSPPALSPFLPWQLQHTLGVPGSDRTRDHAEACALTERLAHSAPQAIFSYAVAADPQSGHQRLSPALANLPLQPYVTAPQPTAPAPIPYQLLSEQPSLSPLPPTSIQGGAQILQHQAACAFRAFAEHRLFSSSPGTRALGLDPGERGSIVHRVMQEFWNKLQGQLELRELSEPARAQLLDTCIESALAKPLARAQSSWDHAYLDLQAQRLRDLLLPWLLVELARPDFAVQQSEKELRDVQLGPLTLTLRVDRIDQTDLGPVILDYKTGSATPAEWLSDRPDQPQLPLYAILADPPPAGIAFALLRAGDDLSLKGFGTSDDVFGRTSKLPAPTFEDQLADWRRILLNLAESFAAGDSVAAPKSYPKTCTFCQQRILCRLNLDALNEICDEEEEDPQPQPGSRRRTPSLEATD